MNDVMQTAKKSFLEEDCKLVNMDVNNEEGNTCNLPVRAQGVLLRNTVCNQKLRGSHH